MWKIKEHTCLWKQNEDGDWETECDKYFCLEGDKPKTHKMYWCCFCGGKLKQKSFRYNH